MKIFGVGALSIAACGLLTILMARSHLPAHQVRSDNHEQDNPPDVPAVRVEPAEPARVQPVHVSVPRPAAVAESRPAGQLGLSPIAAMLTHRVASGPVDAEAAHAASNLTAEIYGANVEHANVAAAKCARTVCEVELEYGVEVDHNALALRLGNLPSLASGAYYQHDAKNNRLTVFVARAGESLFPDDPN
jgi:hypothetical protein